MKRLILGSFAALMAASIAWGSGIMETEKKSFRGIDLIDAKTSLVSLNARAGTANEVVMELVDIPDAIEVVWSQNGSILKIEVKKPIWYIPFNFRGKILLSMPEDTELDVASASGSISIEGISGPKVKADSASGSIKLADCETVFDLHSASGSIEIKDCDGGKLLSTASGSIRIESSDGDVAAKSASGSIRVNDAEGSIKVETASGSVKFEDFNGRINASSASGSLSGDGVLLTGDSILNSVSGSVKFELDNKEDDLRFDISTVSGSIAAGSTRGGKRIQAGSGNILIQSRTVSGSISLQ